MIFSFVSKIIFGKKIPINGNNLIRSNHHLIHIHIHFFIFDVFRNKIIAIFQSFAKTSYKNTRKYLGLCIN